MSWSFHIFGTPLGGLHCVVALFLLSCACGTQHIEGDAQIETNHDADVSDNAIDAVDSTDEVDSDTGQEVTELTCSVVDERLFEDHWITRAVTEQEKVFVSLVDMESTVSDHTDILQMLTLDFATGSFLETLGTEYGFLDMAVCHDTLFVLVPSNFDSPTQSYNAVQLVSVDDDFIGPVSGVPIPSLSSVAKAALYCDPVEPQLIIVSYIKESESNGSIVCTGVNFSGESVISTYTAVASIDGALYKGKHQVNDRIVLLVNGDYSETEGTENWLLVEASINTYEIILTNLEEYYAFDDYLRRPALTSSSGKLYVALSSTNAATPPNQTSIDMFHKPSMAEGGGGVANILQDEIGGYGIHGELAMGSINDRASVFFIRKESSGDSIDLLRSQLPDVSVDAHGSIAESANHIVHVSSFDDGYLLVTNSFAGATEYSSTILRVECI